VPVKENKIGEYLAKIQARRWLSRALCAPGHHTAQSWIVHRTTESTCFSVTMPNIHRFKKSSLADSANKPVLMWLLTILYHTLKSNYNVPCNLSLITALVRDCHSLSDINVSPGSVATHMRCGGVFNKYFAVNLLENLIYTHTPV